MFILTRELKAKNVAERWRDQYYKGKGVWSKVIGRPAEEKWELLAALGENPDPDLVDAIIGNDTWTRTEMCDECELNDGSPRVGLGVSSDFRNLYLCKACAERAAAEFGPGQA